MIARTQRLGYALGRILALVLGFGLLLYLFGPYENAKLETSFDTSALEGGIEPYFQGQEARFDDITPGVEKQVIWFGEPEAKTKWVVLYIHGFSATSKEIRPVPDQVAKALDANLILTRLTGHGRDGAALAEAKVSDWMRDVAEALAVARKIGDRILIISLSTGGTLSAAAALDPALSQDVEGIVFASPNFGINNPLQSLLTFPAARYWLPFMAGHERSFAPHNADQARYWTTSYPSVAVLPVAAVVKEVMAQDLSQAKIPALFMFTLEDQVVLPAKTQEVARRWGGAATTVNPVMGAKDDPSAHVIGGDIMSPSQSPAMVKQILDWVATI